MNFRKFFERPLTHPPAPFATIQQKKLDWKLPPSKQIIGVYARNLATKIFISFFLENLTIFYFLKDRLPFKVHNIPLCFVIPQIIQQTCFQLPKLVNSTVFCAL